MHLSAMADVFVLQESDHAMKEVTFEDRFGMLVDAEYTTRKTIATRGLSKRLN